MTKKAFIGFLVAIVIVSLPFLFVVTQTYDIVPLKIFLYYIYE